MPPPKREEEEEQDHPSGAGLLPGDYADEDSLPWITAEVMKRSKLEEEDRSAWRRLEVELDNLRYEQGLAASRQEEEKRKKWEEEMQDQSSEYDFSSNSE